MLFRHLKHTEIIPVVAITGIGFAASMAYLARLALKNVDCSSVTSFIPLTLWESTVETAVWL
jgi:hypothetical protein